MEARKAHRFVSMNCEMMVKKIYGMAGLTEEQIKETTDILFPMLSAREKQKVKQHERVSS